MEEIWKDIKDYEGLYQVSNLGRVKSLTRENCYYLNGKKITRVIKGCIKRFQNAHGYLKVSLSKNNNIKNYFVHRLVAESFIPNPNNLEQVNHLDFNRKNNSMQNLEWITCKDNIQYSQSKKIKCLDLETNVKKIYPSIRDAGKDLDINSSCIWSSIYKCKSPYKNRYIFTEIKE